MARNNKQGLDYFPVDVSMDDKVELLEAEHGLVGFAIYVKLLQKIYFNGYYYQMGEDELLLTSKRFNVDINQVNVVINSCLRRQLFNQELFDKYKVLTSQGVQKRFIEATSRRKEIEIISQYWLINGLEDERMSVINVDINEINVDINKQSKVKESKEEKSKVKERSEKPVKKPFGIEGTVKLTQEEYDRLVKDYGQKAVEEKIFALEGWLNKGNKSKSDNLTIRNWFRREGEKSKQLKEVWNNETGKVELREII